MCLPLPTDYRRGSCCIPASDPGGWNDEGHSSRVHNNASPCQESISKVWNDTFLPQQHGASTEDLQGNMLRPHNSPTTCTEGSQSTSRAWVTTTACTGQAHSLRRVKRIQKETKRARAMSPVPVGICPWPRSAQALSYFPSITSYTFCSNTQGSIVTTPAVRTTAFPRQLGWSCLFARTRFASVHTEWVHFSIYSSPTQRNIYLTN